MGSGNLTNGVAFYLQSSNAEEQTMHSPTGRKSGRLPRSFPVGAVYVVEGQGGQHGHLRISARYLVFPGGQRVDVFPKLARTDRPGFWRRRRAPAVRQPHNPAQRRGQAGAKKFAFAGGTGGTTGEE
jgi:hypothetical protein